MDLTGNQRTKIQVEHEGLLPLAELEMEQLEARVQAEREQQEVDGREQGLVGAFYRHRAPNFDQTRV
jgi:hypothetical protein